MMNPIGPYPIAQNHHWLVRRGQTTPLKNPLGIVIHTTGATAANRGAEDLLQRQATGRLGLNGWHYLVDPAGSITECIPPTQVANHCATKHIPLYRRAWRKQKPTQNVKASPDYTWWVERHLGYESPLDHYPTLFQRNPGSINRSTLGIEVLSGQAPLTPAAIEALRYLVRVVHPGLIVTTHSDIQPLRRNNYDLNNAQRDQIGHLLT